MKNSKIVAAMTAAALTVSMMAMPASADIESDVEDVVAVAESGDVDTTDAETTDGETTDSETTAEEDHIIGDIGGDGKIDVKDILAIAACIKGKKALTAAERKAADINGDGILNVTDLVKIAAHVKGKRLLPGFPAPETK